MGRNNSQPSSSNDDKNLAPAQHGSSLGNRKTLNLLECNKLKNLVSSLVSFRSLMTLEVSRCHELEYLVTPSIANSMKQLKRMTIIDCKNIKIIACKGEEGEKKIEFKQLRSLRLQWLPSLNSFSPRNYSINFPHMDELIVKECPKLEIFSDGEIHAPELKKVCQTGYDKGHWEVDLNTTIKKLNAEKGDTLEELGSLRWKLANLWAPVSDEVYECHLEFDRLLIQGVLKS
ncbi:hypothetical protein SLEP1_g25671 [Rubroshorea leprosula]|uniref:Disease resistance protein At4g27190-like leucine-rich repeats domain-containing protein n=1 Tax=Rubroshorea leprosula TaxID=152421 RepID=A0AAV5JU42_9ROSI|nr:hypothetical protein SLEP1_g25671 [Rubroshorea leprosula]